MAVSEMNNDMTETVPLFINGKSRMSNKTFKVISPLTAQTVHHCAAASVADAKLAVDIAASAFDKWRRTTPSQRRDIFSAAAEIILSRSDEFKACMVKETGASDAWCDFNITTATDIIKDIAGRVATIEGSFPTLNDPNVSGIVMREAYGVVLAIAPWNAPLILGTRAFAFPIAAGNTVVLKATEKAPRCMSLLVSAFQQAGLPPGVLNMIVHDPADAAEITSTIIAHPKIRKINFTGSTDVGRIIGRLAGENLKPVVLELGGKASAIIWEDADLELAANECAKGAFLHAGQICMATEKILIHKAIKERFIELLAISIEKMYPNSRDPPTLIDATSVKRSRDLVLDSVKKGASIAVGSIEVEESNTTSMRPIVVDNVTASMDIYHRESFGPIVALIDITTEQEAIHAANDTEYGLTAAVFTQDLTRGLRLARQIESGAVHINGMTIHDEPVLPHGGAKASGYGRFNAAQGLYEWTRTKNVTFRN